MDANVEDCLVTSYEHIIEKLTNRSSVLMAVACSALRRHNRFRPKDTTYPRANTADPGRFWRLMSYDIPIVSGRTDF